MATAAVLPPAIDLERPASYPIRLGASILKPAASARYSTVRYNYPLEHRGSDDGAECTITPGAQADDGILTVRNGDEEYRYEGRHGETAETYVLVLRETSAVLERLSGAHAYNLVSVPSGKEGEYPQLSLDDEGEDLLGDDDGVEEGPVDPNNPFDFRHFLKAAAEERNAQPSPNTPLVQANKAAGSTPVARPSKRADAALLPTKKRTAPTPAEKKDVKRVKTDHSASTPAQKEKPPGKPKPKTDAPPKIRVDRKASIRRPSNAEDDIDENSGELILENETPVTDKCPPSRAAMSLALSGQLGQGPISLRSAASSPASRVASPMGPRPDEGEVEIGGGGGGGSSPEETTKPDGDDVVGAGDEEDEDADVEDFELPSPAAVHKPSVSAVSVAAGDEDDDLDKQLALAMAEEDDGGGGGGGGAYVVEDEEESEEE